MGTQPSPPILRVEIENFEIGPEVTGTSGYIANFVALEQQSI